jgi:hypothetical protein
VLAQIIPGLGALRVHNLTVGTLGRLLQSLAQQNNAAVAKMTRLVLSGMCWLAARHDAPTQLWPQLRMLIPAVDAHTGEPVVFDPTAEST